MLLNRPKERSLCPKLCGLRTDKNSNWRFCTRLYPRANGKHDDIGALMFAGIGCFVVVLIHLYSEKFCAVIAVHRDRVAGIQTAKSSRRALTEIDRNARVRR